MFLRRFVTPAKICSNGRYREMGGGEVFYSSPKICYPLTKIAQLREDLSPPRRFILMGDIERWGGEFFNLLRRFTTPAKIYPNGGERGGGAFICLPRRFTTPLNHKREKTLVFLVFQCFFVICLFLEYCNHDTSKQEHLTNMP